MTSVIPEAIPYVILSEVNGETLAIEYPSEDAAKAALPEIQGVRPWANTKVVSSEDYRSAAAKQDDTAAADETEGEK